MRANGDGILGPGRNGNAGMLRRTSRACEPQECLPQKARGICNGIVYTVMASDDDSLTLEDENGSYTVPLDFAKKSFRLAFARTISRAQPQTLHCTIVIHVMDSSFATEKHLLTAVSRVTSFDKIRVE